MSSSPSLFIKTTVLHSVLDLHYAPYRHYPLMLPRAAVPGTHFVPMLQAKTVRHTEGSYLPQLIQLRHGLKVSSVTLGCSLRPLGDRRSAQCTPASYDGMGQMAARRASAAPNPQPTLGPLGMPNELA